MSNVGGEQFDREDGKVVRQVAAEVERSARLARWFGTGLLVVAVVVLLLSAGASIYVGAQVRTLLRQNVSEQQEGIREKEREARVVGAMMACILGQFYEHRDATRSDHRELAGELGVAIPSHAGTEGPPDHDPERTRLACEETVKALRGG